jgi:hypothetical protein
MEDRERGLLRIAHLGPRGHSAFIATERFSYLQCPAYQ